jgi:predicted HD phosphohydrolase
LTPLAAPFNRERREGKQGVPAAAAATAGHALQGQLVTMTAAAKATIMAAILHLI